MIISTSVSQFQYTKCLNSESTHFLSDFYFDFFLKLKFLHYSSFVLIAQLDNFFVKNRTFINN